MGRFHATNKGLRPYTQEQEDKADALEAQFIQDETDRLTDEASSVSLVEAVQALLDDKNGNPRPLNDVKSKKVR